ncbi:protealysin inhibitor emfourin [Mycobacterium sp.]|uniref:protealysin inhibitor emfourin n=1 Tax=Mycobacterium sp. TaxID=1785 RepID=UPI002600F9B8|nr:protealysin inhibitor emfourin [Mycobacterium sp.]
MQYFIERRGGLAGLKASCILDGDKLDPGDRTTLEQLLDGGEQLDVDSGADRYIYRITRHGPSGTTTREIPESAMPSTVARAVAVDI